MPGSDAHSDSRRATKGSVVAIARAVVQVGGGRLAGLVLQRFQPGQEGRDADAAGDPDLLRPRIAAGQIEATVGPFDRHRLPRLQPLGQAAGVVAERLDLEGDAAVAAVGAGDGEGMRPFAAVEGDEGELAGAMAAPAAIELAASRR